LLAGIYLNMNKYLTIFRLSWQQALTYRLNFLIWRLRSVIGFLTNYLFWLAIINHNPLIASYNQSLLITYIFIAAFLRNLVLSNVSYSTSMEIANGDLSNYLLKPFNYFINWFVRDIADKALNLSFFIIEIFVLYLLLRPAIILPQSLLQFLAFILSGFLAVILYFFFSFLISAFAFWYPEHNGWPLRFLFIMFSDIFSGASIPLDIFPQAIIQLFKLLPFSYLIFYPNQIWLGRLDQNQLLSVFLIYIGWIMFFYFCLKLVWRRGLNNYGAYGR